ncbi:hypothetical protein GW915_00200 [bacterium]|nr:hypothetical protein [bacterium]
MTKTRNTLALSLAIGLLTLSAPGFSGELSPEAGFETIESIKTKRSQKEVLYLERDDDASALKIRSSGAMWVKQSKNFVVEKFGGEVVDSGTQLIPFALTDTIDVEKSFLSRGYLDLGMTAENYQIIDDHIDYFDFLELREIAVDSENSKLLNITSASNKTSDVASEITLPFGTGGVLATPVYARLVYDSIVLVDHGKKTFNLKGTLYQSLDGEIAYIDFESFSAGDAGELGCFGRVLEQSGSLCLSWLTKEDVSKIIDEAIERVAFLHFEQSTSERLKLSTATQLDLKRQEFESLTGQPSEASNDEGFFRGLLNDAKDAGDSIKDNVEHSTELEQAQQAKERALDNLRHSDELKKAKETADRLKDKVKKLF